MPSNPQTAAASNQKVARPSQPVKTGSAAPTPNASFASVAKVVGNVGAAKRAVSGSLSRQPGLGVVGNKDVIQKPAPSSCVSNKPTHDVRETKEQTKSITGFHVPMAKVETVMDLLKLVNRNAAGNMPTVLRSRGKITRTGIPKFYDNLPDNKIDSKAPEKKADVKTAGSMDKKLPLR